MPWRCPLALSRPIAPTLAWLLLLSAGIGLAGCSSSSSDSDQQSEPLVLGNMLEPFDPPPLEELIAGHKWEDRPVVDFMDRLRREQQAEGPPPLTVKKALALKNNSEEDNEKILQTLGRLAPADAEGVDFGATAVRKANADMKSTNPILYSSVIESEYHTLTGLALFGYGADFDMSASSDVVESWQTSEDRLVDKIVLRDDLTWSDGTPITAHDVEFTFKMLLTEEVIVPAQRQGTEEMRWVQAYDDRTVVFFHKEPLATNTGNMQFYIVPKHIYDSAIREDPTGARSDRFAELENNPVVGGPYELSKRVRGQEFVIKRREGYYMHGGEKVRRMPYFEEVRFKVIEDPNTALLALKKGEVDETELTGEQWASQTSGDDFYRRNTRARGVEWTTYYICWNMKIPLFSDKRVRKAMSLSLDYDEMIDTVFYNVFEPGRGTYHPTSWMFPADGPQPYKQDLDRAAQLLDEAGWTDSDGDGIRDKEIGGRRVPFRFTLLTSQTPVSTAVGVLMKAGLERVGVECIPKPTEFTVLIQQARDRKFQAFMGAWGTGADPDTSTNIFGSGQMRNYGDYENPEVDQLFIEGRRAKTREERAKIYGKIHNILWDDQVYTWLVYRPSLFGFSKSWRGYTFSPRGPYGFSPGFESIHVMDAEP